MYPPFSPKIRTEPAPCIAAVGSTPWVPYSNAMTMPLPLRLLLYALVGYLLLVALMWAMQSRLIHLPHVPGRSLDASPEAIGLEYESVNVTTEDNVSIHGWFVPAEADRGTVLFFHGNAGNISHRLESIEIFHDLGLNTFIIDYRGYGQSEGSPSEEGLYQDGEAAYRYLRDERAIPSGEIVVFGRSLGGAVASRTAAQFPVGALIMESSFTSAPDLGADVYPFLPVRLLARFEYPAEDYIQQVDLPVLVVHSEQDDIIPYHHGESLHRAAGPKAELLTIQGDHNTGFMTSGELYRQGLDEFLSQHLH